MSRMGFSPDAVTNYFVSRAMDADALLTPMKLQKLVYFAHGWHLAIDDSGAPLVSEEPEAWEYGPVFPSAYHEFKNFGNGRITRLAMQVRETTKSIELFSPAIEMETDRGNCSFALAVLDRIWQVYGRFSAIQLSEMTHEEGSPWWAVRKKAKEKYRGTIPRGLNIPNPLIRSWFKKRFRTAAE